MSKDWVEDTLDNMDDEFHPGELKASIVEMIERCKDEGYNKAETYAFMLGMLMDNGSKGVQLVLPHWVQEVYGR